MDPFFQKATLRSHFGCTFFSVIDRTLETFHTTVVKQLIYIISAACLKSFTIGGVKIMEVGGTGREK